MVSKLATLVKKNIKLLLRTKSSALIVIFGPLLLILLIGAAFNTGNIYSIRVGAFSQSYSPLTDAILDGLQKEKMGVIKIETQGKCIESIGRGIVHVCAIFPPNMNVKEGGDIDFYVDNTRLNLVYIILDKISTEVGAKSEQLSAQLTKSIIDTLEIAGREFSDKSTLISELEKSYSESSQKLDAVTQSLLSLNLDFDINSFPFRSLEDNMNKTGSISGLGLLEKLRRDVEAMGKRFDEISTVRKQNIETINILEGDLAANLNYITAVKASLGSVQEDIENVRLTSVGKIVSPIKTKIKPVVAEKTSLNYLFPTLVAMIVMFVSIFLATTLEVREKSARVFFKNFITPTSDLTFLLGNFITNMIVVILQLLVLFAAAFIFFRSQLIPVIGPIALLLLIVTSIFILIGMVIGNIFRSEETGTLAAISIGFILLFFSSTIIPIEALPSLLIKIASFNPFFISEQLLNKILLFRVPIPSILTQLYTLLGYLLFLVILVILTKKVGRMAS